MRTAEIRPLIRYNSHIRSLLTDHRSAHHEGKPARSSAAGTSPARLRPGRCSCSSEPRSTRPAVLSAKETFLSSDFLDRVPDGVFQNAIISFYEACVAPALHTDRII